MAFQTIFQRREVKYLLDQEQYQEICMAMKEYMQGDQYGKSTICNIYFDTPDYLLIRRSMEGSIYKEKLRLRSYGIAKDDSIVFAEIKRKYESVVYKRRISMSYEEALRYLWQGEKVRDSQISHEIDYFLQHYTQLRPAVALFYDRQAFYAKDNYDFRITFDENILWRDYDLSLNQGVYGEPILKEGQVLMEIKAADAIPMWVVKVLSRKHIYKTSFSKYGHAYQAILSNKTAIQKDAG